VKPEEAKIVLNVLKMELKATLNVKGLVNPDKYKERTEELNNEAIALQKGIKLFEVLAE
jgi:hypothetical protein